MWRRCKRTNVRMAVIGCLVLIAVAPAGCPAPTDAGRISGETTAWLAESDAFLRTRVIYEMTADGNLRFAHPTLDESFSEEGLFGGGPVADPGYEEVGPDDVLVDPDEGDTTLP